MFSLSHGETIYAWEPNDLLMCKDGYGIKDDFKEGLYDAF